MFIILLVINHESKLKTPSLFRGRRIYRRRCEHIDNSKADYFDQSKCEKCDAVPSIKVDFAFQPIVSLKSSLIVAHEALVRGPDGEPALSVLSQVTVQNRHRFDQDCRARAIDQAASMTMADNESLSFNCIPNAVANPAACLQRTLRVAQEREFELSRLIFEMTEGERVDKAEDLARIFREYQTLGIRTAIADFGAGYAGLNLLARFLPDIVKIDIDLVRNVDVDQTKQIIVESIGAMCYRLGITSLAEGIETVGERDFLVSIGIDLMQGYLFSRPAFKALSPVNPHSWLRR